MLVLGPVRFLVTAIPSKPNWNASFLFLWGILQLATRLAASGFAGDFSTKTSFESFDQDIEDEYT